MLTSSSVDIMNLIQSSTMKLGDMLGNQQLQRFEWKLPEQTSEKAKLLEAANEFEVLFLQQVMKSMRDASFESGLVRKSEGETVFQSMLDEQYAKLSTRSSGLGLGEMIYQQYQSHLDR